jgi:Cu-Zn family superoxide dismutase
MLPKLKTLFALLLSIAFFSMIGCNQRSENKFSQQENNYNIKGQPSIAKAVCVIHPTKGNKVSGLVTFTQEGDSIKVVADVEGLTPGKHGFHIHEYGDCSAPDGTSTGGHFNPTNQPHGAPTDVLRHVGDLGNLVADKDGKAHYEWTDHVISFKGQNSIIGRGIIIHAGEDDLHTQPTGNAGARVACGVIGIAK